MSNNKDFLQSLAFHIEENGFEVLSCLPHKALVTPLIKRDWQGTGGKLGYGTLAIKYKLSESQIRTICSKFNKPVEN